VAPPKSRTPVHMECRICLSNDTEEALISPCAGCRGSSAHVHLSCAAAFYRSRAAWHDLQCPTCKRDYEGQPALQLAEIGYQEINKTYGTDHLVMAVLLGNLSKVHGSMGNAMRKRELLECALEIKQKHLGPEHISVAATLVGLGTAYGELGDAPRQKELLEQALVIEERAFGSENREISVTLTNLGNACGELGDLQKKKELLERALAIKLREYGPEHFRVACTMANLANAYGSLGDAARQRELLLCCLRIEERQFGPTHAEVAITLTSLAQAHAILEDNSAAHAAMSRALANVRAALPGPNSIAGEMTMFAALLHCATGNVAEADRIWRCAVAELQQAAGENVASAKSDAFVRNSMAPWAAANRIDVVAWLKSLVETPPLRKSSL